jgi:hypothetical protein
MALRDAWHAGGVAVCDIPHRCGAARTHPRRTCPDHGQPIEEVGAEGAALDLFD